MREWIRNAGIANENTRIAPASAAEIPNARILAVELNPLVVELAYVDADALHQFVDVVPVLNRGLCSPLRFVLGDDERQDDGLRLFARLQVTNLDGRHRAAQNVAGEPWHPKGVADIGQQEVVFVELQREQE